MEQGLTRSAMDFSFLTASPEDLLEIAIRGVLVYVALVALLRLTGKRTLAKFNAFDFIVTIALGSMVSTIILMGDLSVAEGFVGVFVLVGAQYLVSFGVTHSRSFQKLVKSEPVVLFYDGHLLRDTLRRERVATEEVLSAIREDGNARLDEVLLVVLETDGSISVIQRDADRSEPTKQEPYDAFSDIKGTSEASFPNGARLPPVGQWDEATRLKRSSQ